MRVSRIEEKIERRTARRRALWALGKPVPVELTAELEGLYDELRVARARQRNGHRDGIVRRARIERELEKLMSE